MSPAPPALPVRPPAVPESVRVQMQLAAELAGVAIWHHELASGLIQCSEPGTALLGLPPREGGWTRDEFLALMHPDDRNPMLAAGREALQSLGPVDLLVRFRSREGSWRLASTRRVAHRDGQGQVTALLGVAMDVTEREAGRLELRAASERLSLTLRAVGMGTWSYDVNSATSHWDEQMWALRGLSPRPQPPSLDEMVAMAHPEDQARVRQSIVRSIEPGRDAQYDFRVILPDGRERWLASRSVQVRDAQGVVLRRIGVNWDVTDAREAAAARHQKDLAMRESQAKSELLARLSHELRTPLNAVLGFSQLLIEQDGRSDPAQRLQWLQHIRSAGSHLLGLINDVLELSRPDAGQAALQLGPVPLQPLLAEVLPMVERLAAERGVQLLAGAAEPLTVRADSLRLRQVLLNLLTNAIKYNRPGGTVRLSLQPRPGQVLLQVADDGIGMNADEAAQAFEPFRRLHQQHPGAEGVGLGLAIVKTLVERMDGHLTLHSQPGQGTEVDLLLPRLDAGPVAAQPPEPAPEGEADRPRRLMYIEDNPVNLLIVSELAARREGLVFRSATTAEAGLTLARDWLPDLLLMDMQLPDGHGLDLLKRLRADPLTRRIPCIALSANAMPEDIQTALGQGFADYWTKPLDFSVFDQAMDALLMHPR